MDRKTYLKQWYRRNQERVRKYRRNRDCGQGVCPICHNTFTKRKPLQKYCSYICGRKKNVGPNNPSWKGGKVRQKDGYILVYSPGHPHASKLGPNRGGYVFEHRIVMEKKLGRYLDPKLERVHHINAVKDDNRPDNLALVGRGAHYGKIKCTHCKNEFLIQ